MAIRDYRSASDPPSRRRPVWEWPGVRTFRSVRFRSALAATLFAIAVVMLGSLLIRQADDPDGQFAIDFQYWHQAARDVANGRSPYPDRYLDAPVVGSDFGYKYPPTFAQWLMPVAPLSVPMAAIVWAGVQIVLGVLAVWFASSFGGARRSVERFLWSGVAAALYLPLWDSVWKGNVSAVQAFQLSLMLAGGAVAGASLATAILLKTTPLALLPAAAVRRGRLLRGAMVTGIVIGAVSVALAPQAWIDFLRIQPNLLTGSSVIATNLAPASMVAIVVPEYPALAATVRVATLVTGITAIGVAALVARRPSGWPAAVLLGTIAMLVIPGVIWYHYLAMLLPFAAFAWPAASPFQRTALLGGAAAVTVGLAWLPLAAAGAVVLAVGALAVLLPSRRAS